ncbi:MAG: hypothetical protein K8R21_14665 [Leptospira sp.]|nr:hypothetical protein [Leptospira sp.]
MVTSDGLLRVKKNGKIKAEIPAISLVLGGEAPRYLRETKRPAYLDSKKILNLDMIPDIYSAKTISEALFKIISSPNICSRKPLYEQYDTDVGLVKVIPPGFDGGLARVPGTNKGIAVSTDCNSRYTYLNPYSGTIHAVCESARNVFVTGAKPLGITNNLNFANPYNPENYYVFTECIRGMGDACRFLDLPVTGGNVSFYNESSEGPVFPTPTIGMVGLIKDINNHVRNYPQKENLGIALIGKFRPTLGGSEYLNVAHGQVCGEIPQLDLGDELNLQKLFLGLNEQELISSAKDLSLGGLLVALCKISFPGKIGLDLDLAAIKGARMDETLFGESACSIIISFNSDHSGKIKKMTESFGLSFNLIGKTISEPVIRISNPDFEQNIADINVLFENGLVSCFS